MSGKQLSIPLTATMNTWSCHLDSLTPLQVNEVLLDIINHFLSVYLDDILIYSRSLDQQIQHVRAVSVGEPTLCEGRKVFLVQRTTSRGFILEPRKLSMDPTKDSAVRCWPTPKDCKQLQWFLWFTSFYY